MSIFNPIKNLIETKQYPHARAYRTTFWGKMADTFLVFSGHLLASYKKEPKDPFKKIHFGIFDYLTLGIHFLISFLLLRALKGSGKAVSIPLGILTLLLNLPRLLFAEAMMLICLPFVLIAWAATREEGNKIKEDILSYEAQTIWYKFYIVPWVAPSELAHYKDCFFFIDEKNLLYYIDCSGKAHDIPIDNSFRHHIGMDNPENRFFYSKVICSEPSFIYKKGDYLKPYIAFPPESYHSIGALLKAQEVDLENIKSSNISIRQNDIELTLWGKTKLLTEISLSTQKSNDSRLFNNMRRLNIGRIEEHIEQTEELAAFVLRS